MINDICFPENELCKEGGLTFHYLDYAAHMLEIPFGDEEAKRFGLLSKDEPPTNLGYFLSDQCRFVTKIGSFSEKGTNLVWSVELQDCLLKQLDEGASFLGLGDLSCPDSVIGNCRLNGNFYPFSSIRESYLLCFASRGYSFHAPFLIKAYFDHVEFASIGRFPTRKEAFLNEGLLAVFRHFHRFGGDGPSKEKICKAYDSYSDKPVFRCGPNAFSLSLPPTSRKP